MADKKKDSKEPFKVSRLSITPMISYQLNNLATSKSYISYINSNQTNKIIVYPIFDKELGDPYTIKGIQDSITSLNYFYIWDSWKLVITHLSGFMIYSENGMTNLKVHNKVLSREKTGEITSYYTTSASIKMKDKQEVLCIATTNSEIYFCEQKSPHNYEVTVGINFNTKKTDICALASANSLNYLVTGDSIGIVHIFLIEGIKEISMIKQVEVSNHQAPINAMKILCRSESNSELSNILVYGDFIGRIILYDLNEFFQIAQINTHVRMITSLDICDKKNEIISGSEDTYLNIWRIDNDNEVHLKVSYRLADQMVMGIQYLKDKENSNIFVSCLEANELTFLQSNS